MVVTGHSLAFKIQAVGVTLLSLCFPKQQAGAPVGITMFSTQIFATSCLWPALSVRHSWYSQGSYHKATLDQVFPQMSPKNQSQTSVLPTLASSLWYISSWNLPAVSLTLCVRFMMFSQPAMTSSTTFTSWHDSELDSLLQATSSMKPSLTAHQP